MDPDENWKKQLEICRALSTTSLSGLSPDDSSDMVVELVACMVALDAWIAGGGFPPSDPSWSRAGSEDDSEYRQMIGRTTRLSGRDN